jgi:hypothetical protein
MSPHIHTILPSQRTRQTRSPPPQRPTRNLVTYDRAQNVGSMVELVPRVLRCASIRCASMCFDGERLDVKHRGPYTPICDFLTDSGCRDKAMLVLGSNTAKQAALMALLDPSTQFRPPLTHTSHHRPALVDLSRSITVSGVSHSHFRRFSTYISAVLGVSLVGVSLLSADVAVTVVWPEVISQQVLIPRCRTSAHWKALAKAYTIVQ